MWEGNYYTCPDMASLPPGMSAANRRRWQLLRQAIVHTRDDTPVSATAAVSEADGTTAVVADGVDVVDTPFGFVSRLHRAVVPPWSNTVVRMSGALEEGSGDRSGDGQLAAVRFALRWSAIAASAPATDDIGLRFVSTM